MPRRFIQLNDVDFSYFRSDTKVLQSINLTIPVGSRIALVGRTGSGKTTLAHILLGLYAPTSGKLLLDGVPVSDEDMPAWQANCAFVPQNIRLLDASVRENVAFCEDPDTIDDDQVGPLSKQPNFQNMSRRCPMGYSRCVEKMASSFQVASASDCRLPELSIVVLA